MAAVYSGAIPDLDALYYANPLGSAHYLGFMAEVQAALDALGINPQGTSGTVASRFAAIDTKLSQSALLATTADSSGPTGTTTETAFTASQYTVPALSAVVGRTYRITAGGRLSGVAGTVTITWKLRWGATTGSPLLISFPQSVNVASFSNVGWYVDAFFTVRSIGGSGTAMGTGTAVISGQVTVADTAGSAVIDTTNDATLTFFAAWSGANGAGANTVIMENYLVERVN